MQPSPVSSQPSRPWSLSPQSWSSWWSSIPVPFSSPPSRRPSSASQHSQHRQHSHRSRTSQGTDPSYPPYPPQSSPPTRLAPLASPTNLAGPSTLHDLGDDAYDRTRARELYTDQEQDFDDMGDDEIDTLDRRGVERGYGGDGYAYRGYEDRGLLDEYDGNEREYDDDEESDGKSALDRTIDRIGMGSYQWTLLALCGFGWMADNLWIQTIAIILPRVQQHYNIPDSLIGYLSSFMFAGMMIGAVGWGSCSDLMGRSTAFNFTLFFASIFGLFASYTTSFSWLCVALFLLGTSVGGSMPTDGTLILEHMPEDKKYLVTALSVFFSLGSVLSAVVGIFTVPGRSCDTTATMECVPERDNLGWKLFLMVVGFITLFMFLARVAFFRFYESPRYLVRAGRPEEALVSLRKISRFNGSELSLDLRDVDDRKRMARTHDGNAAELGVDGRREVLVKNEIGEMQQGGSNPATTPTLQIRIRDLDETTNPVRSQSPQPHSSSPQPQYDSTGSSNTGLERHEFVSPVAERSLSMASGEKDSRLRSSSPSLSIASSSLPPPHPQSQPHTPQHAPARPPTHRRPSSRSLLPRQARRLSRGSTTSSPLLCGSECEAMQEKVCWKTPRWLRRPLMAWLDRIGLVLSPKWIRTTVVVWFVWGFMALAYTMFNVYLPKLLEMRSGGGGVILDDERKKTLTDTMWDVVIFTIGGCPGALVGAYLVESPLGKRYSLAGSTFVTALFCILFAYSDNEFVIRLSTIGFNLASTTMWAILYGWTPDIFSTEVRGTACGTASALSRIGGMIAPVLGGVLLGINVSFPVYTSVIVFILAACCVLLLGEQSGQRSLS